MDKLYMVCNVHGIHGESLDNVIATDLTYEQAVALANEANDPTSAIHNQGYGKPPTFYVIGQDWDGSTAPPGWQKDNSG